MSRILIVDDELEIGSNLCDFLQDEGFDSTYFSSPIKALHQCQDQNFDLVISDMRMPEIDGLGLLKQIKKINPDTSFVFYSAYTEHSEELLIQLGAKRVFAKPVDLIPLMNWVTLNFTAPSP